MKLSSTVKINNAPLVVELIYDSGFFVNIKQDTDDCGYYITATYQRPVPELDVISLFFYCEITDSDCYVYVYANPQGYSETTRPYSDSDGSVEFECFMDEDEKRKFLLMMLKNSMRNAN